MTQIKGDGEAHPFLSPNDEFAGYELWDKGNLNLSEAKKPEMLQDEYARTALQTRSQLEQKLGVNPYKFGMIGSTDSHTSLVDRRGGQLLRQALRHRAEPAPRRRTSCCSSATSGLMGWQQVASGYAGVWATENTREALFDAMKRKETYATTGSAHDRALLRRLGLRGGRRAEPHARRAPATPRACRWAATCATAPAGKAPTFLVAALKDPIGGNLDRIQIVKGWVDAQGERQEKVYDVVWSGDRASPAPTASCRRSATPSTSPNATWTNTIGDPELIAVWKDPSSIPKLRAVYYARVIEIPTPRWTAYDAKRFGVKMPPEVPMTTRSAPTRRRSGTRRSPIPPAAAGSSSCQGAVSCW